MPEIRNLDAGPCEAEFTLAGGVESTLPHQVSSPPI
jgi:hypothetical protein